MTTATIFNETCGKDGLSIYTCSHTYCEKCGSTEDVCGLCLLCAKCEGECEWKDDPDWVAPEHRYID